MVCGAAFLRSFHSSNCCFTRTSYIPHPCRPATATAPTLTILLLPRVPTTAAVLLQRKLSHLRRKLWREAGPPPDLATRLFTERIIYLVSAADGQQRW